MTETAKEAARRLAAPAIRDGYKPERLHEYRDATGEPIYWRIRAKRDDGDKWIRPMKLNGQGFEIGEPSFDAGKPLYNLDAIAGDRAAVVWIAEGEKACDALSDLGAIATTSGGAQSVEKADWSPLTGRSVRIWRDNDDAGKAYAGDVAAALVALGCDVAAIDVDRLQLPAKADAWDWAETRPNASVADLEALPLLRPAVSASNPAGAVLTSPGVVVRRLSDIQSRPIHWLWPGRIARGKVSMIAGHPGLGKSQLTAALAAVVSTGGQWPVDRTACERGSVIFLNAEDDAADTIRPRLEAAGADLTRCEMLDAVIDGFAPDGTSNARSFSLKADLRTLGSLLEARPDAALVVIDPVTAYLSGVDSHVNSDVRALLAPLGELAARHDVAIVGVSHLNKSSAGKGTPGDALMRVSGSLAFVAAARAAYIVVRDQADPNRRLFLSAKNNIGKDDTGLAFSVDSYQLSSGIETSRVMWEPHLVTISADEAMAAPPEEGERSMSEEAVDLLRDMLNSGRVIARDVKRQADELGISQKALRIARERLHVTVVREGFGGEAKSFWMLAPDPLVPPEATYAHELNGALVGHEGTSGGESAAGEVF